MFYGHQDDEDIKVSLCSLLMNYTIYALWNSLYAINVQVLITWAISQSLEGDFVLNTFQNVLVIHQQNLCFSLMLAKSIAATYKPLPTDW